MIGQISFIIISMVSAFVIMIIGIILVEGILACFDN